MLIDYLLFVIVFFILAIRYYKYNCKPVVHEFKNIPSVSRIPIVGCLIALLGLKPENLHIKFKEYVEFYGRSFHARIFGMLIVVTADKNYCKELLSSTVHTNKHMLYNMLGSWLGNGLLLSHGDHWQKMRKIITPTFHFNMLEEFVDVFDRQSMILVQKLQNVTQEEPKVIDVHAALALLTLDVIGEAAMNVQLKAQTDSESKFVQSVQDVTRILAHRFVRPHLAHPRLLKIFAPDLHRKQQEGINYMHLYTDDIIERRRKYFETELNSSRKHQNTLLDILLESNMERDTISSKELRDEVNTFMFEGHDTTASATSFCLYLISRHADIQQKLFVEINDYFGDSNCAVTFKDLKDLTYLDCVVKESLRLYPPIPAIGRWLKEDFQLSDGNCLPAGTNVILLLWQMMRDPEYFPDPDTFLPERHLQESNAYCSYIPFSMGPRNCIGQRFALLEMKTIIVNILRNFELLSLGEDVKPSIKIVLRSQNGVNIGIKQRTNKSITRKY